MTLGQLDVLAAADRRANDENAQKPSKAGTVADAYSLGM